MKTFPECYTCMVRQAVSALGLIEIRPDRQHQTIKQILRYLSEVDDRLSPSEIAGATNQIIREITGVPDPYRNVKEASHVLAMSYLEDLRDLVGGGSDRLAQALKISTAGNVIDVVHVDNYDLWEEVTRTVEGDFYGNGLEEFREALSSASQLLILADNVGETVFDRVLIENLPLPVVYAVKSGPILNDATREYALKAGIDQVAKVIENGTQSPGTVLSQASREFIELFEESPLVLSKGQANYETMDSQGEKVFYALRVKCPRLSSVLGAPMGSLVLKRGKSNMGA